LKTGLNDQEYPWLSWLPGISPGSQGCHDSWQCLDWDPYEYEYEYEYPVFLGLIRIDKEWNDQDW
jgi:hypothetical protein